MGERKAGSGIKRMRVPLPRGERELIVLVPQVVLKLIRNDRGRIFYPIFFRCAGSQVDLLAAFTAKVSKLVGFHPFHRFFAVWAVNYIRLFAMFLHDAAWLAPDNAGVAAQPADEDDPGLCHSQ